MKILRTIGAMALAAMCGAGSVQGQVHAPGGHAFGLQAPTPYVGERGKIWDALFDAPLVRDGGLFFFDQVIHEEGVYSGHNGWGETFEVDVKYVFTRSPQDAVASGFFTQAELQYFLETDFHYTSLSGFVTTDRGSAAVWLTIYSGTITTTGDEWVSFGWTPTGTVLHETYAATGGGCGNWTGPDNWPMPPAGDAWCNDWYLVPCAWQDPQDPQDYVDTDCFDEALEDWQNGLAEIRDDYSDAKDDADDARDACIEAANADRADCEQSANDAYEDCASGLQETRWISGGGALFIGVLAGPIGGLMIGGTALIFDHLMDEELEECADEQTEALVACADAQKDAAIECVASHADALCDADSDAEAAADANDDAFLAALADCCKKCRQLEVQRLDAIPIPD